MTIYRKNRGKLLRRPLKNHEIPDCKAAVRNMLAGCSILIQQDGGDSTDGKTLTPYGDALFVLDLPGLWIWRWMDHGKCLQ